MTTELSLYPRSEVVVSIPDVDVDDLIPIRGNPTALHNTPFSQSINNNNRQAPAIQSQLSDYYSIQGPQQVRTETRNEPSFYDDNHHQLQEPPRDDDDSNDSKRTLQHCRGQIKEYQAPYNSYSPQQQKAPPQKEYQAPYNSYRSPHKKAPPQYSSPTTPSPQPPERTTKSLQVEVSPGQYMPLRMAKETIDAIENGSSKSVSCFACSACLQCVPDCKLIICPECRIMSPMPDHPQMTHDDDDDDDDDVEDNDCSILDGPDISPTTISRCGDDQQLNLTTKCQKNDDDYKKQLKNSMRNHLSAFGVGLGLKLV
jgi:hypothetical protein